MPPSPHTFVPLSQEVPGRIWEGKEAVLAAAGALASACTASLSLPQRRRLVAALLDAAGKKRSAFRKEALVQLEKTLLAFAGSGSEGAGCSIGGGGTSSGSAPAGGTADAAAEQQDSGDFFVVVSPLLLELAASFVEAAQGSASMETDQPQQGAAGTAAAQQGSEDPHPGKAMPAAQVAACLGAAFATAGPGAVRQQVDAAASSLASLLGAAGKPADQLAAVTAGCRIAERAAAVALQAGQAGSAAAVVPAVLAPQQAGTAALLQGALRLAEEGKASQLREESYRLR